MPSSRLPALPSEYPAYPGRWRRYDADDHKATFLVELKGMPAQVADVRHMRPDIRVETDTAERRHIRLIIAAKHKREPTVLTNLKLQICYQGTPDPMSLGNCPQP